MKTRHTIARSSSKVTTPSRSSLARHEDEAQRAADQLARPRRDAPQVTRLPPETGGGLRDAAPGGGRPLAPAERSMFEARFARDFSQVRVHADAQAAQAAGQASARAFTVGRHIVFGQGEYAPGHPESQQLLAHELAHVAQQQGAPGTAIQRQPMPDKKGPGSAPPSEPFTIAKGTAAEDRHILFEQDSVDLSPGAEKTLLEMVSGFTGSVTLQLHGYASAEGDSQYNLNLSANRAAAVKARLLAKLPPGSKVELYARGETDAFGAAAGNRRVGVRIVPGVTAPAGDAKDAGDQGAKTGGAEPSVKQEIDAKATKLPNLGQTLFPATQPGVTFGAPRYTGTFLLPPPILVPPLSSPTLKLDWGSMRQPFISRGLRLTDRDNRSIEQNWMTSYLFLRSLGLPENAAVWGANTGTAFAYNDMLSRESPNAVDIFERDIDQTKKVLYPNEFRTPIVPLISSDSLEFVMKHVFKKDTSFHFNYP